MNDTLKECPFCADPMWRHEVSGIIRHVDQSEENDCALASMAFIDLDAWNARNSPRTDMGDGWRDIASAPKDRAVLLWLQGNRPVIGCWEPNQYAKHPRPYWSARGEERIYGTLWMRQNQPIYWQPLPAPPALRTGEATDV